MLVPDNPPNETARLESLQQQQVLDTGPEEVFDDIADLAAVICEAPMALITFVDRDRVWFKSKVGISANEVPRDISFCTHALSHPDLFIVPDATQDERFKDNPLVTGEAGIRFYAGAPLRDHAGQGLGMICVLDRVPRELRPSQERALRVLARLIGNEFESKQNAASFQRLEVETANLRLIRTMASHLLHEIGNAVVPLSTHQQLLAERYDDPEFRRSLDSALSEAVRRVFRLVNQMRHLAREAEHAFAPVSLKDVVEEAYKTAIQTPGLRSGRLRLETGAEPILVRGDFSALTDAFGEVILNALQANPADPEVNVYCAVSPDLEPNQVVIEVRDNGKGFQPDALEGATHPFFSTRNVGSGLGLAVAKQVIEKHSGSLEIRPPTDGGLGSVRIQLPLPRSADKQ